MIEKIVWRSVKVKSLEGKMSVSNNALFKRQDIKVSVDYFIWIGYDDVYIFFCQLILNYTKVIRCHTSNNMARVMAVFINHSVKY